MSKFLITGGSGFIGTHIVQTLVDKGHIVLNLDSMEPKNKAQLSIWKKINICDSINLDKAIKEFNPEYVIHLAARTDLNGKTLADYNANSEGVTNLLDSLEKLSNLHQVIFASSMYVCQPGYKPRNFEDYAPHTVYGESKVITEELIKKRNPSYNWSIIRPTSIWGPYFGEPYDLFFKIVLSKRYFHMGQRACKKTYGYIDNAVFQILKIFETPVEYTKQKVFYIGDYSPYDISEWADEIGKQAQIKIPKVPFAFFRVAALFGDSLKLIGFKFPMTSFRLKNMTTDNIHDLDPIKKLAPVLPTDRVQGTKTTVAWIKAQLQ